MVGGKCWDIIPENGLFKIENHETQKHAYIDFRTEQGRHGAFGLMEKIGFNKEQRGTI